MSKWDFLIDFLGISFLWKVNRAGEIESKLQVNLEYILILSQISRISRIWSLGRLLVSESK